MLQRSIIIFILIALTFSAQAQNRKGKKKKARRTASTEQPSALNPGGSERAYAPKVSRKGSTGTTYNAERDFYERMEALEKTKRKNEKLQDKPQYSDPMYFGHKKPPKKHKPGKMKYCKECGIRH